MKSDCDSSSCLDPACGTGPDEEERLVPQYQKRPRGLDGGFQSQHKRGRGKGQGKGQVKGKGKDRGKDQGKGGGADSLAIPWQKPGANAHTVDFSQKGYVSVGKKYFPIKKIVDFMVSEYNLIETKPLRCACQLA